MFAAEVLLELRVSLAHVVFDLVGRLVRQIVEGAHGQRFALVTFEVRRIGQAVEERLVLLERVAEGLLTVTATAAAARTECVRRTLRYPQPNTPRTSALLLLCPRRGTVRCRKIGSRRLASGRRWAPRRRRRTCAARGGRPSAGAPRRARRPGGGSGCAAYSEASGEVVADAGGAVGLDGLVDDPQRHLRHGHLDAAISVRAALLPGGVHQPRGVERVAAGPGRCSMRASAIHVLDHALLGQRLAERDPARRPAGTSARARVPPRRWCACSGGCGRGRAGPGRWRTRRPPRRGGSSPARGRRRTANSQWPSRSW